jgi:hypothetical protein
MTRTSILPGNESTHPEQKGSDQDFFLPHAEAELSFTLKTNPQGSCSSGTLIRFHQKSSHCKEKGHIFP